MRIKTSAILGLILLAALPTVAGGNKKKQPERAMLQLMEAVPCGAKQKGLTGLGSFWASAGMTHVNSDEKLCPQYNLLTDQMEYHIRPVDLKHPVILPVGQEVEIKIKKDRMLVRDPNSDKKMRDYEVVAMTPANSGTSGQNSAKADER